MADGCTGPRTRQKYVLHNVPLIHVPQDAPYLLEPLAESFESEPPAVRAALLTAAVQLFFRRPPECARLLGRVLAGGVQDAEQDVHDRALLYYRCGARGTVRWYGSTVQRYSVAVGMVRQCSGTGGTVGRRHGCAARSATHVARRIVCGAGIPRHRFEVHMCNLKSVQP